MIRIGGMTIEGSKPQSCLVMEAEETGETGEAMDPEIWGRMPSDVMEEIVCKLPVTSILRFRAVCRRWNKLPFEKQFAKMYPHQVGACPPFLSPQCDILYIEGSGKWRTIPFHFFPLKNVILEASGGGLLLFSKSNLASRSVEALFVCNPITKEWYELSGFSVRFISVTCIDVDHVTLEFTIVVAGWTDRSERQMGRSPLIEIYDSKSHSWNVKLDAWDQAMFQLRGVALVKGILYLAVYSTNIVDLKVFALDVNRRVMDLCGEFAHGSKFHCFGQCEGILTAVLQRSDRKIIEIWQLRKQGLNSFQWVVFDTLLEEKLNAFSTAAVAGGFIFFNYYDEPIALYDLRDQSWRWVDFPPGKKYWLGLRPVAFQPSFVPLRLTQSQGLWS